MDATDRLSARILAIGEQVRAISVLPVAWAARLTDQHELIDADVSQWLACIGADDGAHGLHSLLYAFAEFRALYYHRLACGNATGALAGKVLARFWKATPGLEITTKDLGPGLFIAHGQATCVAAESMGRNCYVHQGVTIGWDYRGMRGPVIGDGVFFGAGAMVLGEITVGDGARIGANAVVLADVPAGATAVGAPARVVLRAVKSDDQDDEDEHHGEQDRREQPSLADAEARPGGDVAGRSVEGGGVLLVGEAAMLLDR
jgi:serine O-acetyltransferase